MTICLCLEVSVAKATTPADLTITPRDRRFGRGAAIRRWWLNDDPIATAFYNALSVTFPKGEGYFVDSVRQFREGTPPRLTGEINAFIKQEVIHTREHVAFNRRVVDAGYDISRLEKAVDDRLALTAGKPPIVALAASISAPTRPRDIRIFRPFAGPIARQSTGAPLNAP